MTRRIIITAILLHLTLFRPLVFGAEYLVGVGKDETTGRVSIFQSIHDFFSNFGSSDSRQKGMGFDPSVIKPAQGDVVVFEFRSGQHSVVQSTFENPCLAMSGGFDSGVFTVSQDLSVDGHNLPSVRFPINSTLQSWFFDSASNLCSQGAIFAINPTDWQTPAFFKANAAKPLPTLVSTTSAAAPSVDVVLGDLEEGTGVISSGSTRRVSGAFEVRRHRFVVILAATAAAGVIYLN